MKLIRKGDDVSPDTLEKIRATPWKARPPIVRQIIRRCEERDDPWENIPQEDCTSERSEDISPPQEDIPREDPHVPPQTQLLRRQGDLPNWQDLIGSSLEELKMAHPDQATNEYFDVLSRSGYGILVTEGHKIIRNIVTGEAESVTLRGWIHQLNTTTGDNNVRKKITVTTQDLGPSVCSGQASKTS
jgi:hypothetical protein